MIPICRCPNCGARWVLARLPVPGEAGQPMECLACSEEYQLEGGQLVSITRPASTLSVRERRS